MAIKQVLKFGVSILGDGESAEMKIAFDEGAIWLMPHNVALSVGEVLSRDFDLSKDTPSEVLHVLCSNGGPDVLAKVEDKALVLFFFSGTGKDAKPSAPSKDNVFDVTGFFVF